jgi:hypothetical protein
VREILQKKLTYDSCASVFKNVKELDVSKSKAKPVVVLDSKVTPVDQRHVTQFLPMSLITKITEASAHVQNSHTSVHGVPAKACDLRCTFKKTTYTREMVNAMREWHKLLPISNKVENAVEWVGTLPSALSRFVPDDVFTDLGDHTPETAVNVLKKIDLSSNHASYLCFTATHQLDDVCMTAAMWQMRKTHEDVEFMSPHLTAIPFTPGMYEGIGKTGVFKNPDGKVFLLSIFMPTERHWCSAVLDTRTKDIVAQVFDPLQRFVDTLKVHIKQIVDTFLPEFDLPLRSIRVYQGEFAYLRYTGCCSHGFAG